MDAAEIFVERGMAVVFALGIEGEEIDLVLLGEFFEQIEAADFSAGVERHQVAGLHPQNFQRRILTSKCLRSVRAAETRPFLSRCTRSIRI